MTRARSSCGEMGQPKYKLPQSTTIDHSDYIIINGYYTSLYVQYHSDYSVS